MLYEVITQFESEIRLFFIAIKFIKILKSGRYQSGQLGQTVTLLAYAFVGSNPALPTKQFASLQVNSSELNYLKL